MNLWFTVNMKFQYFSNMLSSSELSFVLFWVHTQWCLILTVLNNCMGCWVVNLSWPCVRPATSYCTMSSPSTVLSLTSIIFIFPLSLPLPHLFSLLIQYTLSSDVDILIPSFIIQPSRLWRMLGWVKFVCDEKHDPCRTFQSHNLPSSFTVHEWQKNEESGVNILLSIASYLDNKHVHIWLSLLRLQKLSFLYLKWV